MSGRQCHKCYRAFLVTAILACRYASVTATSTIMGARRFLEASFQWVYGFLHFGEYKWGRARLFMPAKIKWETLQDVLLGKPDVVQIQISSSILSSHNQKLTVPLYENLCCLFSYSSIILQNLFRGLHQRFKLTMNNASVIPKDDDKTH